MSIEFHPFDVGRCSLPSRNMGVSPVSGHGRDGHATSPRRVAANRRNARRSTGPKTREGKLRASRNALKHGLCADTAIPPCEDIPTFNLFVDELRAELQPNTIMQKVLFPQIANLIWRLRRLPEAQADIFAHELHKAADGETLTPPQILARRFSDDPSNGFALLGRYERALQSMLLRLMRQYEQLKKHHPHRPYAPDEDARVPSEGSRPAWTDEDARLQRESFERRAIEMDQYIPPRNEDEARIDQCIWDDAEQIRQAAQTKRTQSKPTQNADSGPKTRKWHDPARAPVTKRTQRGKENQ